MRSYTAVDQFWEKREAPLDDRAIQQHVRALAVTLNAARRAPLAACPEEEIRAVLSEAQGLCAEADTLPASLEWFCGNGRVAEALFAALLPAERKSRFRLPAREDGVPRVRVLLHEIVRHSDAALTEKRLTDCLSAFDEVRALEMSELWAVP